MRLDVSAEIPFSRAETFAVYRDKLPELVKYLVQRFPHTTKGQHGAPEAQAELRYLDIEPLQETITQAVQLAFDTDGTTRVAAR